MSKGKLSFLIGLPRSGKSTYSNNWLMQKAGRVVVGGDDIRKALTGERYNSHVEGFIFPIEHLIIRTQLNRGCDVLADDTHTTWKSIRELLKIDPDATPIWYPHSEYEHFYSLPFDGRFREHVLECKIRAEKTNQSDLKPVIDNMAKNLISLYDDFWNKLTNERELARQFKSRIQME